MEQLDARLLVEGFFLVFTAIFGAKYVTAQRIIMAIMSGVEAYSDKKGDPTESRELKETIALQTEKLDVVKQTESKLAEMGYRKGALEKAKH